MTEYVNVPCNNRCYWAKLQTFFNLL